MTEDELLTAIENTMQAAHRQCQPYFLQLAKLWLPGVAVVAEDGSAFERKPLQMAHCDQCIEVPFNGFGNRSAHDNPNLDITLLGSLGQICRADEGPASIDDDALASGLEYTDVLIRRHLYPQTMRRRPPFVLGYDVVGEIDQLGDGVSGFQVGDRVADMTVLGSNAAYCTLRADRLIRVPVGTGAAEAAS